MDAATVVPPLAVPARLTTENIDSFRRDALRHVARCITRGDMTVIVDVSHVEEMDIAGAAVLDLIRSRSSEYGLSTHFVHPTRAVREAIGAARRAGASGL